MEKTKKYTYIDSLRGYAVLMVLATHVYAFICNKDKTMVMGDFFVQCRMGVMLFFMISALTLFLSLDQKMKTEIFPIRNFFIRRFFRIAPLFYLIGIINLFWNKYTLLNILATLTFTNGFLPDTMKIQIVGGGWTIAVEMMFYLLVPLLFMFIKDLRKALIFFVLAILFSALAKYFMQRYTNGYFTDLVGYTYYWLPAQLPVFALGIIVYFMLFKTDMVPNTEILFKKCVGYTLAFLSIYFVITLSYANKLFITENIAFSFALMLIILAMAIYPSSFLNNRYTQFLGKISYSFYLLHGIVVEKLSQYSDQFILHGNKLFIVGFVLILLFTTGISYLSYRLIEEPFQKLGARLIKKKELHKPGEMANK